MKIFRKSGDTLYEAGSYGRVLPDFIASAVGWIAGKVLLFGLGYCAGQIIRGVLRAFGIILPSLF